MEGGPATRKPRSTMDVSTTADRPEIHVLLVEDSATHARILDRLLEKGLELRGNDHRLRITHARSLHEAKQLVDALDIDVVSLDLGLQDSLGIATFRDFAAHAPDVPIVVVTAEDDEELQFRTLAAGAQGFVVKRRTGARVLVNTMLVAISRHARMLAVAAPQATTPPTHGAMPERPAAPLAHPAPALA